MSLPAVMLESGCLSASIADVAEPEKQSSRDDQKQTPTAPHGCHGHHSGVPAETLAAASEVPFAQSHARMMAAALPPVAYIGRSEEHTSEPQSLMRISYAVFCLQKQNRATTTQ